MNLCCGRKEIKPGVLDRADLPRTVGSAVHKTAEYEDCCDGQHGDDHEEDKIEGTHPGGPAQVLCQSVRAAAALHRGKPDAYNGTQGCTFYVNSPNDML